MTLQIVLLGFTLSILSVLGTFLFVSELQELKMNRTSVFGFVVKVVRCMSPVIFLAGLNGFLLFLVDPEALKVLSIMDKLLYIPYLENQRLLSPRILGGYNDPSTPYLCRAA